MACRSRKYKLPEMTTLRVEHLNAVLSRVRRSSFDRWFDLAVPVLQEVVGQPVWEVVRKVVRKVVWKQNKTIGGGNDSSRWEYSPVHAQGRGMPL